MSALATGPSNPEGGPNAVDNRRGTDNSVAPGVGEQLHDGWVHPYFACDRHRRGVGQNHPGEKSLVVHRGPGVMEGRIFTIDSDADSKGLTPWASLLL